MNPEQPLTLKAKEAKHLRMIIFCCLVLVLFGIVAAYVYHGMQLANQPIVTEILETEFSVTSDREAIIKALENAPVASEEDARAINEALVEADAMPTSDRESVLRALNLPIE